MLFAEQLPRWAGRSVRIDRWQLCVPWLVAAWLAPAASVLSATPAAEPAAFTAHCAMCHDIDPAAPPGPGPNLAGLKGRPAGTGRYDYSSAMRASGIVWGPATLSAFLADPLGEVPGTTMPAPQGLSSADREAIATYLVGGGDDRAQPPAAAPVRPVAGASPIDSVQNSEQATFRVVTFAACLRHPWGMQFLPDGDLLVTERPGTVQRVAASDGSCHPVSGAPGDVYFGGNQAGLHGLVLHPQFASNSLLYIAYITGAATSNRLKLVRYRLLGDTLVEPTVLFQGEERTGRGHSGGRMVFLADGTLLLGVGHQIGDDLAAQRKSDALGSVIRIDVDGTVPPDNPFVAEPDTRAEIYTWGNRNPQGLAIRPGTHQVWEVEHGPMGGDELNLLARGANYGWPLATFGREYDGSRIGDRRRVGTALPVWFWVPSIAPGALAFYHGTAFPDWQGDLFVTALKARRLERFEMDGDHVIGREILLDGIEHRVRDIVIGPDGLIYLALDSPAGRIIRLEPVPKPPLE